MAETAAVPITAAPKEDQLVEHAGKTYRTIREGLAYILVPPNTKTSQNPRGDSKAVNTAEQQAQKVFYNPIQQFNRDLSVLAIKAFGEDLCERRRIKYEKTKDKYAARRDRKKDRKRKRALDEQAGELCKVQRVGVETEGGTVEPTNAPDANGEAHEHDANSHTMETTENSGAQENQTAMAALPTEEVAAPQPSFRILDALSATGLRALRYAQEIPFATSITANDMDRKAVKSIELHLQHNKLTSKIRPIASNAIAHMYGVAYPPSETHGPTHVSEKYDVIDLDPYGTAAPFIDAALQALNDGGLLCVTCTDSGVFASCGYSEKTFALYGGLPAKGNHCHEVGLRLIAQSIAMTGAKHGISIEPLLSLSIDFYIRLFIRVRRSPADVKFLAGKTMVVYECDSGCGAYTTQMLGRNTQAGTGSSGRWKYTLSQGPSADKHCEHCGSKTHIAGPMWAGPLHHPGFVEKILADVKTVDKTIYGTTARIEGMLDTALDELLDTEYAADPVAPDSTIPRLAPELIDRQPFFFLPSSVAKVIHCQAPPEAAIKGALRHAGYRATRSHCKAGSIKTNAPWSAIWEVFREWVRQKCPVKVENIREGSPGWNILGLGKPDKTISGQQNGTAVAEDAQGVAKHAEDEAHVDAASGKMKVIFDEALGRDKTSKKLVRYQANPRENWGPMSRAK